MGGKRRPKRSSARAQTKVFGGILHVYDGIYGTRRGAERRRDGYPKGVAHIHKRPGIKTWETWISTGRRRKK